MTLRITSLPALTMQHYTTNIQIIIPLGCEPNKAVSSVFPKGKEIGLNVIVMLKVVVSNLNIKSKVPHNIYPNSDSLK